MSSGLHGGALRFIADRSVLDRDGGGSRGEGDRFVAHTLSGREEDACITVNAPVDEKGCLAVVVSPHARQLFRSLHRGRKSRPPKNEKEESQENTALGQASVLYDRIVDDVDIEVLPSENALTKLANAMAKLDDLPSVSRIPAAFTYLGQLIAHDMTQAAFDKIDDRFENYKIHALTFDSILDQVDIPERNRQQMCCLEGGMCLGSTTKENDYEDLPRNNKGKPYIPDLRNDNNLAVAQLTVALTKFYRKICELLVGESEETRRIEFRRHIHSIILHEYLKVTCDERVYSDLQNNCRRILEVNRKPTNFLVPAEFAGACFRFGHSQIRNEYSWNDKNTVSSTTQNASLGQLLNNCWFGDAIGEGKEKLSRDWPVNWEHFFPTMNNSGVRQFGENINVNIASRMKSLSSRLIYKDSLNLTNSGNIAELTLLRGRSMRLPTPRMLLDKIHDFLPSNTGEREAVDRIDLFSGQAAKLKHYINCHDTIAEITKNPPLWFFILQESAVGENEGERLGPLCSRIVLETIHCAISATKQNIICDKKFRVITGLQGEGEKSFSLSDMLKSIE